MDSKDNIIEVIVTVNFKNFLSTLGILHEYNPNANFYITSNQFKIYATLNQTTIAIEFKYNKIVAHAINQTEMGALESDRITDFPPMNYTLNVGTMIKKLNACQKSEILLLRFYSNSKFYISSTVSEFKNNSQISTSINFNLEQNINEYTHIVDYIPEKPFEVRENLDILIGLLKSIEASKDIRGYITQDQFTLETIGEQSQVVHTINKSAEVNFVPSIAFERLTFKIQKENLMKLKGFKKKLEYLNIILAVDSRRDPIGLVFIPKLNSKNQIGKIEVMIRFDELSIEQ